MADKEESQEASARGNEWEVVSLTASAYAAAPGPKDVDSSHDTLGDDNEAETSNAMFMSGHFIFPPSEHENLPVEPLLSKNVESHLVAEEGGKSMAKDEGTLSTKGLASHEFPGIQIFDEGGNRVLANDVDFEKEVIFDKERSNLSTEEFSSLISETNIDKSCPDDEGEENDAIAPQDQESDSELFPSTEGGKCDGNLPCEAWWKRRAVSLYINAKEANTFWSIFIAATVMGLIIIGHQWQDRWKGLHLKWQFGASNEKMSKIISPISRFKDVIVGGHRRGSLIGGSASKEQ